MTTRTLTLILLTAILPASLAAQTEYQKAMEVEQVKMRVTIQDAAQEAQVVLTFEEDAVSIRSANDAGGGALKRVRYEDIKTAEQPGRDLTIRCVNGTTVLRLHKSDRKRVRRELALRGGVVVKTPYVGGASFDWPGQI